MNNNDPEKLPYRELPHGSAGNLYLVYLAQCRAAHQKEASRSTFYKTWKRWKVCMSFHKKSTHSLCFQCSELRAAIRAAKDFQEHARLSSRLLNHYTLQYKDRQVYYLARERSSLKKDLICLNIDSFDKSKISLPKYPFGRTPKKVIFEETRRILQLIKCAFNFLLERTEICLALSNQLQGTYLTLTAVLLHGFGVYFFLAEEGMGEGSSWNWECVAWRTYTPTSHFPLFCCIFVSLHER